MTQGWAAAAVIASLVVAAVLHYEYWVWRLTVPADYAEHERIATPDGSAVEVRRLGVPGLASTVPTSGPSRR